MSLQNLETQGAPDERAVALPVETYKFGPFLLDVRRRLLLFGPDGRAIPEKLFQILLLLLEADGRTVPKEAFFSRVWPERYTSEANLTQHIFMLRSILGETARDNPYIVTIGGEGYRLAVRVEHKIGLNMKQVCERCQSVLAADSNAYICSYECTFCANCVASLNSVCPNCGGELVSRPRRK